MVCSGRESFHRNSDLASTVPYDQRADIVAPFTLPQRAPKLGEVVTPILTRADAPDRDIPARLLSVTGFVQDHLPFTDISMPPAQCEDNCDATPTVYGLGYFVYWGHPYDAAYIAPVTYVPGTYDTTSKHRVRTAHTGTNMISAASEHALDKGRAEHANVEDTTEYPHDGIAGKNMRAREEGATGAYGCNECDERTEIVFDLAIVRAREDARDGKQEDAHEDVPMLSTEAATSLSAQDGEDINISEKDEEDFSSSFCCKAPGCPLAFTRASNLLRHVRAAHSRVRSMCLVCGDSLARQDVVVRHQSLSSRCIQLQQEAIDAGAAAPERRTADDVLASLQCVLRGDQRRARLVASHIKGKKMQRRRK